MSFVESCPSTDARSKLRFTQTPRSRSAVSAASAASVCRKQSIVAKPGEIMPAPLHCALSRTMPAGRCTSSVARFSNASVVWIACWNSRSPCLRRRERASRIPLTTSSTGSWWLIAPVEASTTSDGSTAAAAAAAPCVLAASSRPRRPVAALAQPALASTTRRELRRQRSRLTSTGAAAVLLEVNRAALTGSAASQTSRPTSGSPLVFSPAATPAARKPAGSPTPSGQLANVCGRRHPARAEERRSASALRAHAPTSGLSAHRHECRGQAGQGRSERGVLGTRASEDARPAPPCALMPAPRSRGGRTSG